MTTKLELETTDGRPTEPVAELVDLVSSELQPVVRSMGSLPSGVILRMLTFHPSIDHFKALELIKSSSAGYKPTRLWESF